LAFEGHVISLLKRPRESQAAVTRSVRSTRNELQHEDTKTRRGRVWERVGQATLACQIFNAENAKGQRHLGDSLPGWRAPVFDARHASPQSQLVIPGISAVLRGLGVELLTGERRLVRARWPPCPRASVLRLSRALPSTPPTRPTRAPKPHPLDICTRPATQAGSQYCTPAASEACNAHAG
jgi:hypothetical protein